MMRIAVEPAQAAPRSQHPGVPMPPSPFAFFAETDVLHRWLRTLNAIIAVYCIAMVALLTSNGACSGVRTSFYCNPDVGSTQFTVTVRNVHSVVAIVLGFCAWHLRYPRRCFVLMNIVVLAAWGLALVALGISQVVIAKQSAKPTVTVVVGIQLIWLGIVTAVGGGYGGWKYHRRRMIELLVVVDALGS